MAQLARHGTEAGYKQETKTGNRCERCRNAHREYNRQFTKKGRALGLKYSAHDVIDHLAAPSKGPVRGRGRAGRATAPPAPPSYDEGPETQPETGPGQDGAAGAVPGPSLGERMGSLLGGLTGAGYVADDEPPDYIHPGEDFDPEPDDDWAEVSDDEFVINAAGMRKIEENLGTYLSVIGMTVEMIDPYCGPVIAANMENMVSRWSKVISHYPAAAHLFLDSKGGIVMAWIGAMQATWPVLFAIYEHHFAKNVRVQDGQVQRKVDGRMNGAGPRFVDATMPPMPESYFTTE